MMYAWYLNQEIRDKYEKLLEDQRRDTLLTQTGN